MFKKKLKKILIITLFITVIITNSLFLLFLIVKNKNEKKIKQNKKILLKNNEKNQQKNLKLNPVKTITITDKILKSDNLKKMFFDYEIERINLSNFILTIKLDGNKFSKSDAADFIIDFSENLEVKKIIDGESFELYPRKISEKNKIIITGTSNIDEKNKPKLAKPETTFIKIHFFIKQRNKITSIKLNQEKTKIFFQGDDITDIENSFKEINLKL